MYKELQAQRRGFENLGIRSTVHQIRSAQHARVSTSRWASIKLEDRMTGNSQKLDSLLNIIEMNCDPTIGSSECNRFSLDCLSLIQHELPSIAAQAFTLLTEYINGQARLQTLVDMRIKCWQYLDENHKHAPLHDPVVSAIRAVIFSLQAQQTPEERNFVDHLSSFLMWLNNVEPHFEEQESLLQKHFAQCFAHAKERR